jgi:protein phosphatase
MLAIIPGVEESPVVSVAPVGVPSGDDDAGPGFVRLGWKTDVGRARGHNEDALFVFMGEQGGNPTVAPFVLTVMADGMGGHQGGEIASALASRIVGQQLLTQIYLPMLRGEERAAEQPSLTEVLKQSISQANYAILQTLPGSGTTLTCAMMIGDRLLIGHVGDSRAYLIRGDEEFRQLTHDHSLVQRLVEMGQLSPEEAAVHPQRNVLYRAVGQGGAMDVDVVTHLCHPGERVLLCSDGLWEMISAEEIQQIVLQAANPQIACNRLIDAANEAGGHDNITAILVEVQQIQTV